MRTGTRSIGLITLMWGWYARGMQHGLIPDDDTFNIVIRTPRLELVTDVELNHLSKLTDVVESGIHPPDVQPFGNAWTDHPNPATTLAQHLGDCWDTWRADNWHCPFTVMLDGHPIGIQTLSAKDFNVVRVVRTGSWLGMRYQGNGYGTEMRSAVLEFAFGGLGAHYATTSAHDGSTAAKAINRKLGYVGNGWDFRMVRGQRVMDRRYILIQENFKRVGDGVVWDGLEASAAAFGVEV